MLFAVVAVCSSLAQCQRSCPVIDSISTVHEQAVSINTDVLTNTTFYPIPQVALTISNAPTSLDTLTTLTWTETTAAVRSETPQQAVSMNTDLLIYSTFSSTPQDGLTISDAPTSLQLPTTFTWTESTAAVSSATPLPSQFVLAQHQYNRKRQSGSSFVSPDGTLTSDCENAVQYSIVDGQLLANTSQGTVYYFSTSPGVPYAPFIPTTVPGNISTTFRITTAFTLSWRNTQFYNREASFCSVNDTVYAVFQPDVYPDGCFFAPLSPAYGPGCVLWGNSGVDSNLDK